MLPLLNMRRNKKISFLEKALFLKSVIKNGHNNDFATITIWSQSVMDKWGIACNGFVLKDALIYLYFCVLLCSLQWTQSLYCHH